MADAAEDVKRNRGGFFTVVFFCIASLFIIKSSTASGDAVTAAKPLRDGGAAVVSSGGVFELGFFTPGSSKNRYLGIWYAGISPLTTVWVANRAAPLADSSGVLRLTPDGALQLLNRTNGVVWSSNSSSTAAGKTRINTPVAQLLDSGNLVVSAAAAAAKDQNDDILWESFDDPTDTLLPGLKLGKRRASGPDRFLTPWKSPDDPAPGELRFGVDPQRYQQLGLRKGSEPLFFSGPWNGVGFSGTLGFRANQLFKFIFVNNETEKYQFYYFEPFNRSLITRYLVNATGESQWWNWNDHGWLLFLSVTYDNCYRYALCGAYSTCNSNDLPLCRCLDGFVPRSQADWDSANWSGGCVRKTPLGCGRAGADGFLKLSGAKLPDTLRSWYNGSMNLEECRSACLRNCSCTAFAASDIRGGSGCLTWFGDLIDIRYTFDNGQDFYIRMAASQLDQGTYVKRYSGSRAKKLVSIIVCTVAVTGIVLASVAIYVYKKRQQRKQQLENEKEASQGTKRDGETEKENFELPLFDLATISYATDNFSFQNKLGEGGFGAVYKGILKDGLEIAVKRLCKGSNQGLHEFKNEVMHIAKLQHRNLVKLLGCCFQVDEMMLVYEYMPNNSLDSHMFDQAKSTILDWSQRLHIINGIARGLLYLHHDSRLRIIHRDLKASNILLDKEMNPKISDFGMAKCFGENETAANTKRVVGTYGYIAPEYAVDGCYSTKSDVFSFGVLVLEIVSGKKNRGFDHPDHSLNLLGHAWKLLMEDRSLEVIDESIKNSCNPYEAMRAIHLGLLCVQQHPDDRPSMSSVVLFLGTDTALPSPKQPGFFMQRDLYGADFSSGKESYSANKMSITLLEAR